MVKTDIKNFKPRLYQEKILDTASKYNTLIVLPTGMGKTNIFLMVAANRLRTHPNSKIFLVGPTKPLIDQYKKVFEENFEIEKDEMAIFTGMIKPEKRKELWKKSKIIFSTPQGLQNDIMTGKINLNQVSLLGIDEAHRATGNYSYVWLANNYMQTAEYPRITGMTASPGTDKQKITEICKNLSIEKIEVRKKDDPDVAPYIQEVENQIIKVELTPEMKELRTILEQQYRKKILTLKNLETIKNIEHMNKKDILLTQSKIFQKIREGDKNLKYFKAISHLTEIIKIHHAIELLETQGIQPLKKYLEKTKEEAQKTKTKAVQNLVKDPEFTQAIEKTQQLEKEGKDHPKLKELAKILQQATPDEKTIVFTQFRDTATKIKQELSQTKEIKARIFVGQAKKAETGMSQKEQKQMLQEFSNNEFNVLIATSIAEEGLDIPKVDTVIMYEPVPSAIRQIQRRGRTGRKEKGKIITLVTKNTRDEIYVWVSKRKEQKMHSILTTIKQDEIEITKNAKKMKTLDHFQKKKPIRIIADTREKNSPTLKHLYEQECQIDLKLIEVADYICGERTGIEIKTKDDFTQSIIDGRLFRQIRNLKEQFETPILIIIGENYLEPLRNVSKKAILGAMTTIMTEFGVNIITTKTEKETAELIISIAEREQHKKEQTFGIHFKKPITNKELQEYIIASLPGIERKTAQKLLQQFKTIKDIVNAEREKLEQVETIGEKRAKGIKEILEKDYEN